MHTIFITNELLFIDQKTGAYGISRFTLHEKLNEAFAKRIKHDYRFL